MQRICLLLACLFLFCGWVEAQNDKINFNETTHDFGMIGDKDGNVNFDFIFTNNSDAPVVISRVQTSCGCTTPVWTREPIEPKKTGKVTVSYKPSGIGPFNKSITVHTNLPKPISLKIRGNVVRSEYIPKKLDPEEEYPVAQGNYLLKSKELQFDQVEGNEKKTIRLEVFNNSDKSITQKTLKLPKYITVTFNPAIIPAKTAGTVDVILNVQDKSLYGNLSGEITLLINEVRQSFPYSATVLDDFSQWTSSQKSNAGKINVSAKEINFGNFSAGNSRTLKISNSGKSPLNVHNIQLSDPAITVSKTNLIVEPKEIAEIKINVDKNKIQSSLSSSLAIITDDPSKPIYEVTILANKRP